LTLTDTQALAWEAGLSRLGGQHIQQVSDGSNRIRDDTDNDAASITLSPPTDNDVIDAGEFVVTEWTSTRINEGWQRVEAELAPAAD